MDLLALKPFRYGSPRRRLNRGDAFRAVSPRDFKVLVAAGLAQPGQATYETTDVVASPVSKRGRFAPLQRREHPEPAKPEPTKAEPAKAEPAKTAVPPMTTSTAGPLLRRPGTVHRDQSR